MTALRNLSARPELLRDDDSSQIADPVPQIVGVPGPFGRHRVVFALPMGPVQLQPRVVLHDGNGAYLADPQGNLIGTDKVVVHRMLAARWTEDTRRLAGG